MAFNIIPAIDLLDGKVVRLHKGKYDEVTVYSNDLLPIARAFKELGFEHIHIVDLNGAKEGRFINLDRIKEVKKKLNISVQTGGGVRSLADIDHLMDAGIDKVICTSMAVKNEKDWFYALKKYGGDCCILGLDLKDGQVAFSGWLETVEESTSTFLKRHIEQGVTTVLSTDISKDGTLSGPNVDLYKDLKANFTDLKLIASGGVANKSDIEALAKLDIYGCVVGKAYYEQKISPEELKKLHQSLK